MDVRLRLAKNLKRRRLDLGMSQEELAHRAHLERSYVSGIERGVRNPAIAVLQELAAVLAIKEGDLLEVPSIQISAQVRKRRRLP